MTRRLDRGLLSLLPPLLVYLAFGALRVDAPVSAIGLLFDRPLQFALAATVVVVAGAALLFVRPIERRVAGVFAPSREPTPEEAARLTPLLARLGEETGVRPERLIVRVQESDELNAAAGAAHLLFVTTAALRCPEPELEALLAHELGHHHGLHPLATAMVWWLSLPGEALAAVFRLLRRGATRAAGRVRPLALLLTVLLLVWQVLVMWLYYVGRLLFLWSARVSEYVADHAAARWGHRDALIALYTAMDEPPPAGRLERLTATHPPMAERIARLAAGT